MSANAAPIDPAALREAAARLREAQRVLVVTGAGISAAAIVALQSRAPELMVATQNVDGLHAAAGSRAVRERRGSIWILCCLLANVSLRGTAVQCVPALVGEAA